jgi:hypothetical protein
MITQVAEKIAWVVTKVPDFFLRSSKREYLLVVLVVQLEFKDSFVLYMI